MTESLSETFYNRDMDLPNKLLAGAMAASTPTGVERFVFVLEGELAIFTDINRPTKRESLWCK
jgi:hypothetical protein